MSERRTVGSMAGGATLLRRAWRGWVGVWILAWAPMAAGADPPGAVIYREQCASCHGVQGEGVEDEYDEPLYGNRSVESLARRIERTMPEDEPEVCVGEEALQVAAWIHETFYSAEARLRLGQARPARVEPARLTVGQYRNAVADLVQRFDRLHRPDRPVETGGLKAKYYSSEGMSVRKKFGLERVDSRLDFDFGEGAPDPAVDPEQFAIFWEGSFYAAETGDYRFRIRTPNGARLYVNADAAGLGDNSRQDSSGQSRSPLIDEWVSSGNEVREATARVFLLGGRRVPIRLDYFKYKEATGQISLEWKPPHGVWSVLPASVLSPTPAARVFACTAPFPADDRSLGYERGSAVSKAWQSAVTQAALQVADEVTDRIDALSHSRSKDADRVEKLRAFCGRFAEAALRRPLDDGERRGFVDRWFEGEVTPETAVRRSVLRCLHAPDFLYTELPGSLPDAWIVASRLSFALWDSIPDEPLVKAARSGKLNRPDALRRQAARMLEHPHTRAKVRGFFNHWLEIESRDLSKDRNLYPMFDEAVVADLRESLHRFIDETVWGETSDYRELLLADHLLLNDRLAALYGGVRGEGGGEFVRYVSADEGRAGVLTHPYLLSVYAYHNNTSPIHRGVFMTRNIVGRPLKPPPVAVAFKNDEFDPHLTMREKVTQLTRDKACMACHAVINPLGFSLEHFDAVGRWRDTEQDRPIDARSDYPTQTGETLTLTGARDVAEFAVDSEAAHRSFLNALFHHMVKQAAEAYGPDVLDRLRDRFATRQFSIREVLLEIAMLQAGHGLPESPTPGDPS